jgi:kojibiose phosphorylase
VSRCDPATGLIEQFDGYDVLGETDPSQFPDDGRNLGQVIGVDRVARTQTIKQADVVLMLLLLRHRVDQRLLAANFEHYEPRTDPSGSSLTPSVHAVAAMRTGTFDLARTWFRRAAAIDLGNEYRAAAEGVHAAAAAHCGRPSFSGRAA